MCFFSLFFLALRNCLFYCYIMQICPHALCVNTPFTPFKTNTIYIRILTIRRSLLFSYECACFFRSSLLLFYFCHLHRYCVYTSAANKVWLCAFFCLRDCLNVYSQAKNPHYGKLIKSNVRTNNTHFIIILCDTHRVNGIEMKTELRKQRLYVEWLNVKSYSKIFRFTHECCAKFKRRRDDKEAKNLAVVCASKYRSN